MSFRLVLQDVTKEVEASILAMSRPVAQATTASVRLAGENAKNAGRADIAAAGFSAKWQNALRVVYFPKGGQEAGVSLDAAAFIFHKIAYAGVFETGAHIVGRPMLWIPLKTTPLKGIGRGRTTPEMLRKKGLKLFQIKRPGHDPLLAAKLPAFDPSARRKQRLSISRVRGAILGKGKAQGAATQAIPLFVGKTSVTIKKKFDIAGAVSRERGLLPVYYVQNLKV